MEPLRDFPPVYWYRTAKQEFEKEIGYQNDSYQYAMNRLLAYVLKRQCKGRKKIFNSWIAIRTPQDAFFAQ